jgi:hypothetical protein
MEWGDGRGVVIRDGVGGIGGSQVPNAGGWTWANPRNVKKRGCAGMMWSDVVGVWERWARSIHGIGVLRDGKWVGRELCESARGRSCWQNGAARR